MNMQPRIEAILEDVLERAGRSGPPRLASALRYAVLPGGGRVRPELCLAVAQSCGDPHPAVSDAAAAALELMHCASLVHDDLPSFDNAPLRRGKPTVHRAYSEELAVLVGDGLIVAAFEVLVEGTRHHPLLTGPLVGALARASGTPFGIVAGQSWESEAACDLEAYHYAKTASLFEAATTMGAISARVSPEPWRPLGRQVGTVYQAADDIADALGDMATLGKPVGQDVRLGRPSLVRQRGVAGAYQHLEKLCEQAVQLIPPCRNRLALEPIIRGLGLRLCPPQTVNRPTSSSLAVGGMV